MCVSWRRGIQFQKLRWIDGQEEACHGAPSCGQVKQHHRDPWACGPVISSCLCHHCERAIKGNLAATAVKCQLRAASFLLASDHILSLLSAM